MFAKIILIAAGVVLVFVLLLTLAEIVLTKYLPTEKEDPGTKYPWDTSRF
jgi:hypothetical protein